MLRAAFFTALALVETEKDVPLEIGSALRNFSDRPAFVVAAIGVSHRAILLF